MRAEEKSVWVDASLLACVKLRAAAEGVTVTEFVARCIAAEIDAKQVALSDAIDKQRKRVDVDLERAEAYLARLRATSSRPR